ncbi:MAG: hypothetical protein LBF37_00570 [Rickettsiales bacterium]|jgi:hypothetical protein|nr:hypothetical protein [Rickettsiales bacterium]
MTQNSKINQEDRIQKLLAVHKKLENLVSVIKTDKGGRLFINDAEYRALGRYRKYANILSDGSVLKLTSDTINKILLDIYPVYLCLSQFLNNGTNTPGVLNSINGAGGYYQTRGVNIFKQTIPGKYEYVFDVPVADYAHTPRVHIFGEDILALYHAYRDIVCKAEIFSEVSVGKFEKTEEYSCLFADDRPFGTLWSYTSVPNTQNVIAKTDKGYETYKHELQGTDIAPDLWDDTPHASAVQKLKIESEQYLVTKYLKRGK